MSHSPSDKSLLQLIHEMNVAVLDTDASGRPAAHLWSAWCALSELLPRWDKLNKMVDGLGEAPPSAKNAPWINPAHQFPDEGQEVRFMPLSGNVFNGWYTNDLKTGNPHIDGASAFVRGDGASKIMHASYTPSVVMWWMPLPSAPTDGGSDK